MADGLASFIESAKPLLPIPVLLGALPVLYLLFGKTWKELDAEALELRSASVARGEFDRRPMVALVMVAMVLTLQEYYGGRQYYDVAVFPAMQLLDTKLHGALKLGHYAELWGYGWWAFTRVFGYGLPLLLWKLFFPGDSLLDMGLRTRGFFTHAKIYGLFLAVVLPAMLVVSKSPDFGNYYPFYKASSRSYFDFGVWELMYYAQFFALELFFRGFMLRALRSFGSGAIFAMAAPYCMIHYGKPYLEACGAIIAGVALGSLSMRTKSIWQGFLVHVTVAALMDWLSLYHRHALPAQMWRR